MNSKISQIVKKRWSKVSKADRSKYASKIATIRHAKLSDEQKTFNAMIMVRARLKNLPEKNKERAALRKKKHDEQIKDIMKI